MQRASPALRMLPSSTITVGTSAAFRVPRSRRTSSPSPPYAVETPKPAPTSPARTRSARAAATARGCRRSSPSRSPGRITKNPWVAAAAPSPCSEISRSAPTLAPNRPRASTHGPQSSALLVVRVSRTVAPSASSRRFRAGDVRQVKVASGKPPLVAVPVVLQGFQMPDPDQPVDLGAGGCCCRAGGRGRWRSCGPASGSGSHAAAGAVAAGAGRAAWRRRAAAHGAPPPTGTWTVDAAEQPAMIAAVRRTHADRGGPRGRRPAHLRLRRRLAGLVPVRADAG